MKAKSIAENALYRQIDLAGFAVKFVIIDAVAASLRGRSRCNDAL
jgi:hypothetical protein